MSKNLLKPGADAEHVKAQAAEYEERATIASREADRLRAANSGAMTFTSAKEYGLAQAYKTVARELREMVIPEFLTSTTYYTVEPTTGVFGQSYLAESFAEAISSAEADGYRVTDYGNDPENLDRHLIYVDRSAFDEAHENFAGSCS